MFILFFFLRKVLLFKENPPKVRVIFVFLFCKRFTWHFTTKIFVSCKIRNHPQTNQTSHKPSTNQSNYPQTSQIPNKSPTNYSKIASFFPEDIFNEPQYFSYPSRARREKRNGCIFLSFC